MERKKYKDIDIRKVFINVFPNIDVEALDAILARPNEDLMQANSTALKFKISSDSILNTETSSFDFESSKTTTSFFKERKSLQLDNQSDQKEGKYLRAVKKSVTTKTLPSLNKSFMPDFLQKNIRIIAAKTEVGPSYINKIKPSSFNKNDTIFNLMFTGSSDSEYGYDFVTKRISNFSDTFKFIFSFISPSIDEDRSSNYRNKKDTILSSISNNMRNLDIDRFFFTSEEKNYKTAIHPVQQIDGISEKYGVSYMICGFNGLKGPKGDNKELDKAISILFRKSRIPFIVMKESVFLNPDTAMDGFKWLFVFDKVNHKCFNTFKKYSPLIDFARDTVCALTLLPPSNPNDDIEELFMKEIQNKGCNKYQYDAQKYDNEQHVIVKNKVNFGNTVFNFVVIYNNITTGDYNQLMIEKQVLSNISIIQNTSSNICVMNGN